MSDLSADGLRVRGHGVNTTNRRVAAPVASVLAGAARRSISFSVG